MPLKLSEFDPNEALTGDELVGIAQNNDNRKVTLNDVAAFAVATVPAGIQEWAPNWNDDADLYIPANEAMTIDAGNPAIGTGDISYEKSTGAAPSTFGATTLPVTLEGNAWLKISAINVVGFLAAHYVRTA